MSEGGLGRPVEIRLNPLERRLWGLRVGVGTGGRSSTGQPQLPAPLTAFSLVQRQRGASDFISEGVQFMVICRTVGRDGFGRPTSPGLPPKPWRRPDSWLSMSLAGTAAPAVSFEDRTSDLGGRFHAAFSPSGPFGRARGQDSLVVDRRMHLARAVTPNPVVTVDRPWWRSGVGSAARTPASS